MATSEDKPTAPKASTQSPYTILVAVDDSKEAKQALDFYLDTLHKPENEVLLLHCSDVTSSADTFFSMNSDLNIAGYEVWLDIQQKEKDKVEKLKEYYTQLLTDRDITRHRFISVATSHSADTIIQTSDKEGVRYVVMGTRGQGTIRRTIFGSVSDYVLHHSAKPVFVYRDHH